MLVPFAVVLLSVAGRSGDLVSPSEALVEVREQVRTLKYGPATRSLQALEKRTDLSREDALAFYEMRGLVAGSQGNDAAAEAAFVALLCLDPDFKLKGKPAPKVTTPFLSARSEVRRSGPLELGPAGADRAGRVVEALTFSLRDPRHLVAELAVELVEDGVARTVVVAAAATVRVPVHAEVVSWTATARSALKWTLTAPQAGRSAPAADDTPRAAPAPVVVAPPPSPPPNLALTDDGPRYRPAAYTLLAVGVAALAAGVGFGVSSSSALGSFRAATANGDPVAGLTRAQALELATRADSHAIVANACFVAGGVLAASGLVTWLLGLRGPTVTPIAGGAMGSLEVSLP
jgi:hypothetical protein